LCSALERLVGTDELPAQVTGWLDGRREGPG